MISSRRAAVPDLDRILECGFRDLDAFMARYPDGLAPAFPERGHDDLVRRYLYGSCGILAVAIHRRTLWPIVAVASRPGDLPRHVACEDADGGYVDARGRGLTQAELTAPYLSGGIASVERITPERAMRTFPRHPALYVEASERHLDRLLPDLPPAPGLLYM